MVAVFSNTYCFYFVVREQIARNMSYNEALLTKPGIFVTLGNHMVPLKPSKVAQPPYQNPDLDL